MIQAFEKSFKDKLDLFDFIRSNKSDLYAQKKIMTKQSDSFVFSIVDAENKSIQKNIDTDKINVSVAINTTNLLDSHGDVHLKGIWSKSVKEQRNLYLLKEHSMTFENIISDSVNPSVKLYNWKDLGFEFKGMTEALIFNATISKDRNSFMFNQYKNGYVKEHSVGMRYVKYQLAMNSDSSDDKEEKANWDKWINDIANKNEAEDMGYFWAVSEAKIIEGSAVVKGSNFATPTINVEAVNNTSKVLNDNSNFFKHLI